MILSMFFIIYLNYHIIGIISVKLINNTNEKKIILHCSIIHTSNNNMTHLFVPTQNNTFSLTYFIIIYIWVYCRPLVRWNSTTTYYAIYRCASHYLF